MLIDEPNRDLKRNLSRWPDEKFQYASCADFLESGEFRSGIHTVCTNGTYIDLRILNLGFETTVFVFHAAILRKPSLVLPAFYGRSFEGLQTNLVMVSDPCLYWSEDLQLAWYIGASSFPLQAILGRMIARVVRCTNTRNVIFFGASGGGFAALYNSHIVPGSLAIVINPQTVLRRHWFSSVQSYLKSCFDEDYLEGQRLFDDRSLCEDVSELYRGCFPNHVLYAQNRSDDHVDLHMKPFVEASSGNAEASDRLGVHLGDWGDGHAALPKQYSQALVRSAVAAQGDWGSFVAARHEPLHRATIPEALGLG